MRWISGCGGLRVFFTVRLRSFHGKCANACDCCKCIGIVTMVCIGLHSFRWFVCECAVLLHMHWITHVSALFRIMIILLVWRSIFDVNYNIEWIIEKHMYPNASKNACVGLVSNIDVRIDIKTH